MKVHDCIIRSPVRAVTRYEVSNDLTEFEVQGRVPEGFSIDQGFLYFPAGFQEEYIVGDLYFPMNENYSREEQLLRIKKYLKDLEFDEKDILELLASLPIKEGSYRFLSWDESRRWLKSRPEFVVEAQKTLKEIEDTLIREHQREHRTEYRRGRK